MTPNEEFVEFWNAVNEYVAACGGDTSVATVSMRRALEQARLQTLGVMSFGLAHELRQPLQSIRSEANNINVRLGQLGIRDEDISNSYAAIDRGIERIDKNISFIAEISRGDPEEITEFDLAEAVREEVQEME